MIINTRQEVRKLLKIDTQDNISEACLLYEKKYLEYIIVQYI